MVAAIAAIAGWVRWLIAANEPLWLDELHTCWTVTGELGDVYRRSLSGNQTPLYFWLNWAVAQAFGETELSVRLISLAAGTATIFAAGWLVVRWTGSTIGAVATSILIALDIEFIYYATEARPYALIQFLGLAQVALFWRMIVCESSAKFRGAPELGDPDAHSSQSNIHQTNKHSRAHWLGSLALSLVTALLFYTHYTSAWLMIAEVSFVGVLLGVDPTFRRPKLKRVLMVMVATIVLLIPAIPQLSQIMQRRSNWSSVSSISDLLAQQAMPIAVWVLIPAVVLAIATAAGAQKFQADSEAKTKMRTDWPRLLCFAFLWATLPTTGVVALDHFQLAPMALARYTLVGTVAMPLFAGLAIGFAGHRRIRTLLAIALITLSLIQSEATLGKFVTSGFDTGELPGLRWEDWRTPIQEINRNQSKRNQPVLLASNLIEDADAFNDPDTQFQEYLRFPVSGLDRIENQVLSGGDKTDGKEIIAIPTMLVEHVRDSEIKKIKSSGGAWLIVRAMNRELPVEIEEEVVKKSAVLFPEAKQIQTTRFEVPFSKIYLISFDW